MLKLKHLPYVSVAFAASGIVVVMLALAFAFVPNPISVRRMLQSAKPRVTALASNAFGALSNADVGAVANGASVPNAAGGLDAAYAAAPAPAAAPVSEAGVAKTASSIARAIVPAPDLPERMIAPYEPVAYRYVYDGQIVVPSPEMDVYRKTSMSSLADAPASLLSAAGLGAMNLGSFSGVKMQNATFVEDRDDGYTVSADFQNGTLSISENWERKTNNLYRCVNGRCPSVEPLGAEQVPSDEDVIRAAGDFLSAHGVDLSLYGAPAVDHSWRMYASAASEKTAPSGASVTADVASIEPAVSSMPIRAPEQVSVIYPYLVEGREVRSTNGDPVGMNVSVSIRDRRVASVWGISIQSFEKSPYQTEQDPERIMKFAERGGVYGSVDSSAKTVDVPLGPPSIELVSFGHQAENGNWEELYVPAFVFPVVEKPENAPWLQNNVVVPLVKDLLVEPEIQPPMLMKDAPSAAVKGSAGSGGGSGASAGSVPAINAR